MNTVDMSTDIVEATASCFMYVLEYQRIKDKAQTVYFFMGFRNAEKMKQLSCQE